MGIFDIFKARKKAERKDAELLVNELEALAYFKYANRADLPDLKTELVQSLAKFNYLGIEFDDRGNSKDLRAYHLDGEDLFESGVEDTLKEMAPLFKKMKFTFKVTEYKDNLGANDKLTRTLKVNGRQYILFKDYDGGGWGESAQRFADMVNHELEIQGIDERIYLENGGNDGFARFLTADQYRLFTDFIKGVEKPTILPIDDWCRAVNVERVSVLPDNEG